MASNFAISFFTFSFSLSKDMPVANLLLATLFVEIGCSTSALIDRFVCVREWSFGEETALEADLRSGVEEDLVFPLAWDDVLKCLEAGKERGVGKGGSGSVLDKMLENAMGSFVRVVLGSTAFLVMFSGLPSSTVPCEKGRLTNPFV